MATTGSRDAASGRRSRSRPGSSWGWFELRASEDGSEAELGYRLRASAWGKGFATEGSRALVRVAFAEIGLRRVWAETMAVNTASRHVLEKAGLRLVRTFYPDWKDPIDGAEHGEVEYELLRDDQRVFRSALGSTRLW